MNTRMQRAWRVVLLLSLAAMLMQPAQAAGAQECVTAEHVMMRVRQDAPDVDVQWARGELAARLRDEISKLTGNEVPGGGSYLIVHRPGLPASYIVRFQNGCATHHGYFPYQLVTTWLAGSAA